MGTKRGTAGSFSTKVSQMIDLLTYITQNLTGSKDITVTQTEVEGRQEYTIKAPKEVMGLLIGKEGRTIRAIRNLARARAIVDKILIDVKLEEKS